VLTSVSFDSGSAVLDWQDANPDFEVHSWAFSKADQNLHRSRLCAAIVDRLTFGGNITETRTDSHGLAHTRKQQQPT